MEHMQPESSYARSVWIAAGITTILIIVVIAHYQSIKTRQGTIVLPAGGTYLGPSTSETQTTQTLTTKTATASGNIAKGTLYPYAFEVPAGVKLVTFDNNPYDIFALDIAGQNPSNNVLIGVDDLTREAKRKIYIDKPLTDYINDWWKQFEGLKGVSAMNAFTNNNGLEGYRVTFSGGSNTDIFFFSPDHRAVIHLANGPLSAKTFDAIVDSVSWRK